MLWVQQFFKNLSDQRNEKIGSDGERVYASLLGIVYLFIATAAAQMDLGKTKFCSQ